jgi:thiosulfate/3-mercaptopyruvate sulfurtransferase
MATTLIEPDELAAFLARPDWAIVDCRFELTRPEWGASAYSESHIPGAVYAHLDRDLSGPVEASTGRHPLPSREQLAATLGRWGIGGAAIGGAAIGRAAIEGDATGRTAQGRQTQVVAYDQGNGAHASRLWWLLRWMGHSEVAVLNGGFAAWQRAGLPVSADSVQRAPGKFVPQPSNVDFVTADELAQMVEGGALADGQALLIDARGADRFAGENETIDPVAGHVPGARNHPFAGNVDAHGRFLPADQLRHRWLQRLGSATAAQAISMCGSGVTACHNLLAMEVAGLGGARLYAGSWSEWIRDPARPIARGPA